MPKLTNGYTILGGLLLAFGTQVSAQNSSTSKPPSRPAATQSPMPSAAKAASVTATARAGKGWKVGPIPSWVVAPPSPTMASAATVPASGARRDQLVDFQTNHALTKPEFFVRIRSVALDAATLGQVSQPQISFNPAFQTTVIHHASVVRDGQRSERLADARIEPMRREQLLEQQVIDGRESLLILLNDVRVGDAVEIAYSVIGDNPIFEGRISGGMQLAAETPIDLLHHRLVAPAGRTLRTRGLATTIEPERFIEGRHQVLRVVREKVAGIAPEQGTPPWHKVYPAIDIAEFANWAEVNAWAERLFALPQPTPKEIAAKAAQLKAQRGGLSGAALASEVLRFVQDEVRYFSVSLGESSHRPKPPQQTLADRLGDCKDKVVLLNALLVELGFDARPALVSMRRNRGIENYLPSPDVFDHVVTWLELDGKVWFLDATLNGQGLALASRGQFPFGRALVVGPGTTALATVPAPPAGLSHLEFEQIWDLTQPGKPASMESVMRANGVGAERWRAALAAGGLEPIAQAVVGGYARALPGLKPTGGAEVKDDREANHFVLRQRFEVPDFGTYDRGALQTEYLALELLEVLSGPPETQRKTPFLVDQPQLVEHRTVIRTPHATTATPPTPVDVVDRQFRFSVRTDVQGNTITITRRYERRSDEVAAADTVAWRDKVMQARQATSSRLRVNLLETTALMPELQQLERRLRGARGWREDELQSILMRNEFIRLVNTKVIQRIPPDSRLAARVLISRAVANNLLGDAAAGKADARRALGIMVDDADALDALAVAQVGLGEIDEALATFSRITPQARPASVAKWMGSLLYLQGRAAEAVPLLREAAAGGSGEDREFALVWLYLASELAERRGRTAVEAEVDGIDGKKLTGALLRYLTGRIDRDLLLKVARERREMERLNLSEVNFYIGQQLVAQGRREEATVWFKRTVEQGASPYREHLFALLELQRAGR
jgi:lipoprotein NlpI